MSDQLSYVEKSAAPPGPPLPTEEEAIENEAAALVVIWGLSRRTVPPPVSAMQLQALLIIEQRDATSLGRLAVALNASPSSTSRLCDRLQGTGWIRRATHPADARELTLALTPSGQALLTALRERRRADLTRVLQEMPQTARAALLYGLRAFATAAHHAAEGHDLGPGDWPAIAARLLA